MPYIGRDLNRGNYLKLDDISSSFNGSTQTFNLTVGGSAFTPGSAFSILVSVGGVIQEPESAYQVNNSEITFANAPTAQDGFFCIALGVALGIGVPGSGTVNGPQMAKPFNYDGFFYLDDANNRVGIGSLTPTSTLDIIGDVKVSGNITGIGGTLGGTLNGNVHATSGISTFYDLKVTNNLTVEGTTTTLDTNLIGVDRVEVGANSNSIVGVAVTQSGTADIVNLFDGATKVVTVDDTGNVGIGSILPVEKLHVSATGNPKILIEDTDGSNQVGVRYKTPTQDWIAGLHGGVGYFKISKYSAFGTNDYFTINGSGSVGINTSIPKQTLEVFSGSAGRPTFRHSGGYGGLQIAGPQTASGAALMFTRSYDVVGGGLTAYSIQMAGNTQGLHFISGDPSEISIKTRLFLGNTGKVGIGTNLPQEELTIMGATPALMLRDSDQTGSYTQVSNANQDMYFSANGASAHANFIFRSGNNGSFEERVRIESGGDVGIGTYNALARLDVYKGTSATDVDIFAVRSKTGAFNIQCSNTDAVNPEWRLRTYANEDLVFSPGGTGSSGEKVRITATGEVRIADGGLLTINTNAAATYGVSEALRIDDVNGVNDRAFQIFEYQNSGGRWFSLNQNLDVTTNGSSYTYTQGNFGGSNMIQMDSGKLRIFNDPEVVSAGTSAITPTERVTILQDGRIGINAPSPANYELDIQKRSTSDDAQVRLYNDGTGNTQHTIMRYLVAGTSASNYIYFGDGDDSNAGQIRYQHGNDSLQFHVNADERLRITSSGVVGINTTVTAATQLQVQSDGTSTTAGGNVVARFQSFGSGKDATIQLSDNVSHSATISMLSSALIFKQSGTETLRINSNGKVGIGTDDVTSNLTIHADAANQTAFTIHADMGTNNNRTLNIKTPVTDNDSHPFVIQTPNALSVQIDTTEKFRVHSNGAIGINSTSPVAYIDVEGSGTLAKFGISDNGNSNYETLFIKNNVAGYPAITNESSPDTIELRSAGSVQATIDYNNNDTAKYFRVMANAQSGDGTELFRVQENGKVGIGSASPAKKLQINTTGNSGEGILLKANDNTYPAFMGDANRDNPDLFLVALQGYWNGTRVGEVTVESGSDTDNKDEGMVKIRTRTDGETSPQDRFTVHHTGQVEVHSTTQSTLTTNGALRVNGGIGVAKNIICGGALEVQNNTLTVTSATPNIMMAVPSGGLDSRIYNDGSGNFIIGHGTNSSAPTERITISSSGQIKHTSSSGNTIFTMQRTNTNTTGAVGTINFAASDDHSVASIVTIGDGNNEGAHITFRTTTAATSSDPYHESLVERLRITSDGNVDVMNGGELGITTNTNNTSVLNFKNNVKDHKLGGVCVQLSDDTISDDIMLPGHRHGCLLFIFAHSDASGTYPQPGPCGMVYVDAGQSTNIRAMFTQGGTGADATTTVGNLMVGKSSHETDINNCDDGKLTIMKGSANGRIKLANRLDATYYFYLTMM